MSSKPKSDCNPLIVGDATGNIAATMVDAIKKLGGDCDEIRRMLRIAQSIIGAELRYQEDRTDVACQD